MLIMCASDEFVSLLHEYEIIGGETDLRRKKFAQLFEILRETKNETTA